MKTLSNTPIDQHGFPIVEKKDRPIKVIVEMHYNGFIHYIEAHYAKDDSGKTTTRRFAYYDLKSGFEKPLEYIEELFAPPGLKFGHKLDGMGFDEFRRDCSFYMGANECDAFRTIQPEKGVVAECQVERCPMLKIVVRMSERNRHV
jgi:hypothetical protein